MMQSKFETNIVIVMCKKHNVLTTKRTTSLLLVKFLLTCHFKYQNRKITSSNERGLLFVKHEGNDH